VIVLFAVSCSKKEEAPKAKPTATKPEKAKPKKPEQPKKTKDPLVEKGQYLVHVMGCQSCHTPFTDKGAPDFAKAWAGGLEVPEKFGTWRSPNITQDKETGIGGWTDEQIAAAIREGKRPDGDTLFPIMPYMFYAGMSDDDVKALVAYLRTIKPISNKVERVTDLKLPKMPGPPTRKDAAPDNSDPAKRGEYLAGLMHCAMCHSPMDKNGGPDMSKAYSGGFKFELPMMGEGALYGTNLTSDKKTGVGDWTDDELLGVLKNMKKKDGSPIMGPMMLFGSGWSQLKEEDLKAVVAFLRTLPPVANKVPASTFKPKGPPPASAKPVEGAKKEAGKK
jgi:mono/diheme cytochrome c family protein